MIKLKKGVRFLLNCNLVFRADLPEHEISVSSMGTNTAGEFYTLSCSVTIADPLLGPPLVEWLDFTDFVITNSTTSTIFLEEPIKMGSTTVLHIHFSELKLSHAGAYTCRGTSSLPEIGLVKQTNHKHILSTKSE